MHNKLKLSAIEKIQGHLSQTHKDKTRQVKVTTTQCVTFKEQTGPSKGKWKTACLINAQGKKLLLWIPLDNQSTVNLFGNKGLLSIIRKVDDSMTVMTNGGELTTNMKRHLASCGDA